ncbi:RNA polymerase sigma factor [Mucilaginibacter sp. UR6-11]|uniref:RNA polymerase sigma factor n=1 Tax=Mucilaginibacter sp. UR6-11 TaxID=1435644 RepID=UPI001E2A5D4B|nr:RNA polymerase sigma-70 factor [Mucilaginibacter sp. UR6-11]MCC8426467.1 RNA polymerase sigma-70 factor [Mucilaginibacter sp. UR6-11]
MIPIMAYGTYTDNELAVLLKGGDQDAFTEIYNRFFGLLYIHACKRLKSDEEAKDIIQDLFAALWNKRESLQFGTELASYLYAAVRNRILNLAARSGIESRYMGTLKDFTGTEQVQSDFQIREKQLTQIIEREIGNLPPKMREIFLMSRTQGYSHKEIAEQLNISEHTVRTQVKNALRILRTKLGLLLYVIYLLKTFQK